MGRRFGKWQRPGQVRDERGHFRKAVYVIHEEPITVGGKSEVAGDGTVADAALDDGGTVCENPISGNRTQPNTNILNQGEPAASPGNNSRGMYFPESKELSDAFRDFVHMRRRKGGGSMTDRAIALTKDWIRRESVRDGRFEVDIAIDILNYSTMNGFSKLYTLEERKRQLKPNRRDLSEKSPSYEGKSDEELEKSLLAN